MTSANRRARTGSCATSVAGAALAAASIALAPGCIASSEEVRPPEDDVYFPTGIALAPDGRHLGVVSANSDLRYDSGTLVLFDVSEVRDIVGAWLGDGEPPGGRECRVDRAVGYTLRCRAAEAIREGRSVRLGNFATEVAFQELASGGARAFVTVRGDPSLTWVDVDPDSGELSCGGDGPHHRCDEAHRLRRVRGDSELDGMPTEPFGLFVDGASEYAVISHLTTGGVTLVDAPATGEDPVVADVVRGLFLANSQGIQGAVGVAGRLPGAPGGSVYVTSRSEPSVRTLSVVRSGDYPELAVGPRIGLRSLGRPGNDGRGIAFNEEGTRGYVVNRSPPALQMLDTQADETGDPANRPLGSVGLCRQGSNAVVGDAGRGERVYVACFRDHEVWVVNPATQSLESIIPVGRGPHGLAVSEDDNLLFVSGFLDHSLSVVDLEPGSDTENRVVLRLGREGEDAP